MLKLFCCCLAFLICAGSVGAETWTTTAVGAMGDVQTTSWRVDRNDATGQTSVYVQGQDGPLYTLTIKPSESLLVFAGGLVRRFAPGFLMLSELPLPLVAPGAEGLESGSRCFTEHVGDAGFRLCAELTIVTTVDEARSLPAPSAGQAIIVIRDQEIVGIRTAEVQAWRME